MLDVTQRCYAWTAYKAQIPGHGTPAPRFLMKIYNKRLDPQRNSVIKTATTDGRKTHWVPAVQTRPERMVASAEAV